MFNLKVDPSDLMKWARFFDDFPRYTKRAICTALNVYGEGLVKEYAQLIGEKYGWDPDIVRQNIMVSEAEPVNLVWAMDATLVVPIGGRNWQREWDTRDQTAYEQNTLVNIITMDDGYDCKVCQELAENGPYTLSEIIDMQAKWADYVPDTPNEAPGVITNLVHPRCRCMTMSWTSSRRLAASSFQGSGNIGGRAPERLFSMHGLAKRVLNEVALEIKIQKRYY